jgi:hypothetical protein
VSDRIDVSFGVNLPTREIAELHAKLEELHKGTIDYCNVWDELSALHKAFLVRLEGECLAYMNIAKEKVRKDFFGDQG